MTVAHSGVDMRWTEIITIYLAIGAPFAAARLLRGRVEEIARQRVVAAILSAAVWPLTGLRWATTYLLPRDAHASDPGANQDAQFARAELLQRRMIVALYAIRDQAIAAGRIADREIPLVTTRLRESVQQYVGLSSIGTSRDPDEPPAAYAVELYRVAGVRSADQSLAAKCLHRRNLARWERHRTQAREDLLRGLTALCTAKGTWLTIRDDARPISQAFPLLLNAARDLFQWFEDTEAVNFVENLIRAEETPAHKLEVIECNTPMQSKQRLTRW